MLENTDLLNLHRHQQNPQLPDENWVNLSSWIKSLAHEVEKQTPTPKLKTLFKQSENLRLMPENQITVNITLLIYWVSIPLGVMES